LGGTRFGGFALFAPPFLVEVKRRDALTLLFQGSIAGSDLLGGARGYGHCSVHGDDLGTQWPPRWPHRDDVLSFISFMIESPPPLRAICSMR
jgi:hypothetical protein